MTNLMRYLNFLIVAFMVPKLFMSPHLNHEIRERALNALKLIDKTHSIC